MLKVVMEEVVAVVKTVVEEGAVLRMEEEGAVAVVVEELGYTECEFSVSFTFYSFFRIES